MGVEGYIQSGGLDHDEEGMENWVCVVKESLNVSLHFHDKTEYAIEKSSCS